MSKRYIYSLLHAATAIAICVAIYMAFIYTPQEKTMGDVQRIFYFHVPLAWVSFLAFFVVFITSIVYLAAENSRWDDIASSSAEIGTVFCTLTIITGSLWAKPVWGRFWTWDMRLTTTLVLWFIYIAYFMIRSYTEEQRAPKLAAVFGIIGFIDVPIVYFSVRWWRTMHPGYVVRSGGGLGPRMLSSLIVSVITFTMLYVIFLILRTSTKGIESGLDSIEEKADLN